MVWLKKETIQEIREGLFRGHSVHRVAGRVGVTDAVVEQQKEILRKRGVDRSRDLLTVSQAAAVMNLTVGRVRVLCREGRLGEKHGPRLYLIDREELLEFMKQDRAVGTPGRKIKQEQVESRR